MRDFKIVDNLIFFKRRISAVFKVEPFDVALLSEQDRGVFYSKIRQALNVLSAKIQIIAIKERAKITDYSQHFNYILSKAEPTREKIIKEYVKELTELVENENILILKYYIVFSRNINTSKPTQVIEGIKKLEDVVKRFTSTLYQANVKTSQLADEHLINFVKKQLR